MRKILNSYSILLLLLLGGTACTDVIDVELPEGETLLAVDGWIYDTPGPYTITLSTTAPYMKGGQTPRATGASLHISDNEGFSESLVEVAPGEYQTQSIQGKAGSSYTLSIAYAGGTYEAVTSIKPSAVIDSLTYEYKPAAGGQDAGYFLYYFGQELPTAGDYYHLRIHKNGEYFNKPSDLIFVSDQIVDGNYIHDLGVNWEPFAELDVIRVEMLSITEDTYQFLLELSQQTNNGGMFPNPIANVRSNVINTGSDGPKAVGYFGGASFSALEGQITAEKGVIKP